MLPLALFVRELAFRHPDTVELVYGRILYPRIASGLGRLNAIVSFALAEALLAILGLVALWRLRVALTSGLALLRGLAELWTAAGCALMLFLLLWGLHYARPGLEKQLNLSVEPIEEVEILELGKRFALLTAAAHRELGVPPDRPTRLPLTSGELDAAIDRAYTRLRIPGDFTAGRSSPAKRLFLSPLVSYLGLSGVYVPFTGEPSVNGLVPDAAQPLIVAHEKAHQRGIAREGEANLAAFLACSEPEAHRYLRYAAYLEAASRLLGSASRSQPEAARQAYESLGPGPLADLRAEREFWARYEGALARGAEKVNDQYLKSFRVRGGVDSYEDIVRFLVALQRQGKLPD
jgi:hypothetical protein